MSAPSLLDSHSRPGHDGPARAFVTGYSRRTGLGADSDPGPGTDPLDPLDRLALRLSALCGEAVDPLAIVAGLEAEGHNDRLAQERHDLPDLFALAEELYRRVPRSGGRTEPGRTAGRPGDRAGSIARPLLRGSLFAVPALCGLALLPPAGRTGPAVRLGIALIQVVAWGYGQGIAHAAYARLNAGDRQAARTLLRRSTMCALAGQLALFTLLAVLTHSAPAVLLPTATALGYCLAAVPALVLGAELQLAAVLIPIGLATLTWTFGLNQVWGSAGAAVIAGAAVLGTLWLAWRLTGAGHRSEPDRSGLSRRERLRRLRRRRWFGAVRSRRRSEGVEPRRFSRGFLQPGRIRLPLRAARSRLLARARRPIRIRVWVRVRRRDRDRTPTPDRPGTVVPTARRGPGWAVGTMPQALYGSCVGIWLLLVLVGPIGTGSAAQLHAAATLTLSMGAAEWHYAWYRQAMRRSLAANHELGGFARRAVAVLALALARQALTTALLAGAGYALLDRHSGGIGCYLFALALSPGLLAATVIRPVAARGLLALTVLALAATGLAEPLAGAAGAAQVACGYALALAVAAARLSTRPWTNI